MVIKFFCIAFGLIFVAGFIIPLTINIISIFTLLSAVIGAGLIIFPFVLPIIQKKAQLSVVAKKIYRVVCCFAGILMAIVAVESILIVSAIFPKKAPENSVVVVLGAAVLGSRPSDELSARIRTAAEYLQKNPISICIASGGQGEREWISEALCIKNELVEKYGISEDRILMEDQSRNTIQNIENTAELIRKSNLSRDIVLVTDAYHMYRSRKLAEKEDLVPYELPVWTDIRLLPSSVIREFCALTKAIAIDALLF